MLSKEAWKNGVVPGIVASVLVLVFIEPFLRLLRSIAVSAGDGLLVGLNNTVYQNAARGFHESAAESIFAGMLIFGIAALVLAWAVLRLISRATQVERDTRHSGFSLGASRLGRVYVNYVFPTQLAFTVIMASFILWSNTRVTRLNTRFSQDLAALGPYLTEDQGKMFRSRWALMRSGADHSIIVKDLQAIADAHSVALP